MAQVGGSLASYFDVYHRLLASRLVAAARAQDTKQLRSIASEIVGSSVDNQHTYVHAQQLLSGKLRHGLGEARAEHRLRTPCAH